MANRKFGKYLAVSALLACCLTACDDVEAKPSNTSSDLLAFVGDVYGNNYESISDSYHAEIASKTLDDVLFAYAINVVGAYNANVANVYAKKVTANGKAIDASTIVTLSDVVNDDSKLASFVAAHPAYNVGDAAAQKKLVVARYNAMKKSAAKKMFAKIAAHTTDNKFNEKDLLVSLYDSNGKVDNPYKLSTADSALLSKDLIVTPDKKPENVFTDGILHEKFYTKYIDEDIMPDIYRDALVQQYIFDEQEKTLGSSSARKVNYVAIKYDDLDESLYAEKLIKGFVKDYLLRANANVVDAFNLLSSTWNGEFMNDTAANVEASNEWKLLKALNLVDASGIGGDIIDTKNGKSFIKGSAYGDLVEDYAKLDDNPSKSTATRDYTGGNKHVKEIGFQIESDKISLNDHVTDGWFIKSNSEISVLPDAIKNRLFNLSVATGKNNNTAAEITKDAEGKVTVGDGNKYIAKHGSNHFLRNSTLKANQEDFESIIFHDTGSHTYYIINVEEAVSANYMNTDAAKSNYELRIDVASLLSSNDTNVTLSKKHWLEKCDITYHDQSVYDYFESNFPELFADD